MMILYISGSYGMFPACTQCLFVNTIPKSESIQWAGGLPLTRDVYLNTLLYKLIDT